MSARCELSWASCACRCAYWRVLAVDVDEEGGFAAVEEVVVVVVVGSMEGRGNEGLWWWDRGGIFVLSFCLCFCIEYVCGGLYVEGVVACFDVIASSGAVESF